jgi:nucleoside-diphosphate-sugar epimerase
MDDYDKIPAEEAALSQPQVAGTVLRLPMVYGPGDYQHRLGAHAGQLKQGAALEVSAALADWRTCRGYVADIARGIVLAAEAEQAAGRVYNIGEADGFSEREWAEAVAQAVGSTTGVQVVENADGTGGMNAAQHLTINTTRIRSELGYAEALPLAERITRTIAWEQEQLAE